jgi:hypothetical protein
VTILRHNFEGGSEGARIVASLSVGTDDPFDESTAIYSNTDAYYTAAFDRGTAQWVGYVATTNSTGPDNPCWVWNDSMGAQSQIYARWYNWVPAVPSATYSPTLFGCRPFNTAWAGATSWCSFVTLNSVNNKVAVAGAGGASPSSCANTYPLSAWFRVECVINFSAVSAGYGELRTYSANPDADADDWDDRVVFSDKDFNTSTAQRYGFGICYPRNPIGGIYFSGMSISNEGDWIGPAPYKVKSVPGIQPSAIAIHNDVF